MAVDNVTSSTNAPPVRPQVQSDQTRAEEQARKAEQAKREEEARQAKQAQKSENEQKPRPVVNAQGQTTGKVVNTTA